MPSLDNPFVPQPSPASEPGYDLKRAEKHLGPVGAKLRRTMDQKHGSLRTPTPENELPEMRSMARPEDMAILEAYEQRDQLFDDACNNYRQLALKPSSASVLRKAAYAIVSAQKEVNVNTDPFIQELEENYQDRTFLSGHEFALGSAYIAAGQYEQADMHYDRCIGQPSDYKGINAWLELYDVCTRNHAAHHVSSLEGRVLHVTRAFAGLKRLTEIDPLTTQMAATIIDIVKRIPSAKMTEAENELFEMLEAIPVKPSEVWSESLKREKTLVQRGLLEARADRTEEAKRTLSLLGGTYDVLKLELAIAQSSALTPPEQDWHLQRVIDRLPTTSFHPFEQYELLVDSVPKKHLTAIVEILKRKMESATRPQARIDLGYQLLKGAARLGDTELAESTFNILEKGYSITTDRALTELNVQSTVTTSLTYLRSCILVHKPIEPTLSQLIDALFKHNDTFARDCIKKIGSKPLFELIDLMIDQQQDVQPLLTRTSSLIQEGVIEPPFLDSAETLWYQLLTRQTAFAVKQCQEIARKKAALLQKAL